MARNKPTTSRAEAFLAQNPTFFATVNGVDLYEHPKFGDEVPIHAITPSGNVHRTDHWEVPTPEDGLDLLNLD